MGGGAHTHTHTHTYKVHCRPEGVDEEALEACHSIALKTCHIQVHCRPEGADEEAKGSDSAGRWMPGQDITDDDGSGGGGELSELAALVRGCRTFIAADLAFSHPSIVTSH